MSFDVLQEKIREKKNPTVAGLDARIEYVPEYIRKEAFEKYGVGLKVMYWTMSIGKRQQEVDRNTKIIQGAFNNGL